MSFIGGIVGTILSVTIFFAVYNREFFSKSIQEFISFVLSLLDSFISLVPVGIFFGRFGNFLNQELYGTIVPTDFR
jgi:phosphatidylglycerol:prolipoprotein diacylglycerol transferase